MEDHNQPTAPQQPSPQVIYVERPVKKRPFYKRWWFWTITVIFALIAIGSNGNKNSNTQTVSNTGAVNSPSAAQNATATPTPTETITISHSVYKATGAGFYEVDCEATNNDSTQHSATLKATFYDANGNILGTAEGTVNDVASGDTKTFTLEGNDRGVSVYKTLKVQVDTLL